MSAKNVSVEFGEVIFVHGGLPVMRAARAGDLSFPRCLG